MQSICAESAKRTGNPAIVEQPPRGYQVGDTATVQVYGIDHVVTLTAIGEGDELNGPELTVSCDGHEDAILYAYVFDGWTFREKIENSLDSIIDWLDPFSEFNQQKEELTCPTE